MTCLDMQGDSSVRNHESTQQDYDSSWWKFHVSTM